VFILNHVMQKEKRQGGEDGKIYILFVNLTAFDRWRGRFYEGS